MSVSTPAERFRIAIELHETGRRMYLQKLKRAHPEYSERELRAALLKWLLGDSPEDRRLYPGARRLG